MKTTLTRFVVLTCTYTTPWLHHNNYHSLHQTTHAIYTQARENFSKNAYHSWCCDDKTNTRRTALAALILQTLSIVKCLHHVYLEAVQLPLTLIIRNRGHSISFKQCHQLHLEAVSMHTKCNKTQSIYMYSMCNSCTMMSHRQFNHFMPVCVWFNT